MLPRAATLHHNIFSCVRALYVLHGFKPTHCPSSTRREGSTAESINTCVTGCVLLSSLGIICIFPGFILNVWFLFWDQVQQGLPCVELDPVAFKTTAFNMMLNLLGQPVYCLVKPFIDISPLHNKRLIKQQRPHEPATNLRLEWKCILVQLRLRSLIHSKAKTEAVKVMNGKVWKRRLVCKWWP